MAEKDFLDFDALKLRIASPETIRKWSYGEVTKAETINYRTQKPERDGLFCERIFGPVNDYECSCGKYKKIRYKGIVCDRCGVEVTTSAVRRERMGHINLVIPVANTIFYQVPPSKIALILGFSSNEVESIINYETYVVLEKGNSPYRNNELISEEEYTKVKNVYEGFVADTGAAALKHILSRLDLEDLAAELRAKIKLETSRRFSLLRRLRVVEAFRTSGAKPEWMILDVLPVIPPDLRPLVPLDGGRYVTSDLNDLYKRVIVRNNRLKHLLSIKTPEIILKNEKRMLQDAVDALFNNEKRTRPIRGKANRPLKSLCEILRGKQGRFRHNLLGKRVDYSGRSVIVVDPNLKLSQCSLPKEMALELFKPIIIRKLEEKSIAEGERSAKILYKQETPEVWEVLEEVTKEHPVLLNRAPTLHRVSIQAFFPVLSEHRAIGIHPMVCPPFNADFDGDTMSVHVPLTPEAVLESAILMLSTNNVLSPAHGKPLIAPSQDIVAGIYYLTKMRSKESEKEMNITKVYDDFMEVQMALEKGIIKTHDPIEFRYENKKYQTSAGRVLFNEILPKELRFVNETINKDKLVALIDRCYRIHGTKIMTDLLDSIKDLGFAVATKSGLSIGVDDVVTPLEKDEILKRSDAEIKKIYNNYNRGLLTESEKYNLVVNVWTLATAEVEEALMATLEKDQDGFNPIFMLIDSGARGSRTQASQIGGMRGLMAKPQRGTAREEVIETPIKSSFKEGVSVWEYFISTHGARKGLTDTALKTAEAGYLTRRLVDVAQSVIITTEDCGTILGQEVSALREGGEVIETLAERIAGRIALDDIKNPLNNEIIVHAGEEITDELAEEIENSGIETVRVRSVLTCEAKDGLCIKCYGRNLATGRLVELGEAVGVIAAQSIGEPGTQLTLKTFHIGGIATRIGEQTKAVAKFDGKIKFEDLNLSRRSDGEIVALSSGKLLLIGDGRVLPFSVPKCAILRVENDVRVTAGTTLFEWDPYSIYITANKKGRVKFEDIKLGVTLSEDIDERTERIERIIIEDRERRLHPHILIVDEKGNILEKHSLPSGAYLIVEDNASVLPGDVLAKLLQEFGKTKDITGGLPKVADLFEAKVVKDAAVISDIDGTVEIGEPVRGIRKVKVTSEGGSVKEYDIPYGKYLLVTNGQKVKAGDKLCEGPVDPHDILRVKGWLAAQEFLTNQIQSVYRLQKVKINDKHISVIVRQMLRKVKIEDPGDSNFIEGEIVERQRVYEENQRLIQENLRPANYHPILLGITRASLLTESFLSAASFQETTRILSEASIHGRTDRLVGLKENVIVGRLVPVGTGFRRFIRQVIESEEQAKEQEVV
ncbi:MAG: DNA-directed RNA polymerase subunit beta' [candidate division WOR-3 bacterium]